MTALPVEPERIPFLEVKALIFSLVEKDLTTYRVVMMQIHTAMKMMTLVILKKLLKQAPKISWTLILLPATWLSL